MIFVRLTLDKRRLPKNAKVAPLKIVITKGRVRSLIPVGLSIGIKDEWDQANQKVVNNPKKHQLNDILEARVFEVKQIINRLRLEGRLDGLASHQIKDLVVAEMYPDRVEEEKPVLFMDHYKRFMSRKTGGTYDLYDRTLIRLREFCPTLDTLRFEDISVAWLRDFETHISPQSPSKNARNIHLRNIRAVFNDAIDEEVTSFYPFRKFKIVGVPTRKRSLSVEQLRSLFNAEVSASEQKYLDFFKLSFMLCGINVVDLCRLPPLENSRAEYRRAKTHRLYSIKVEPEALAIFEKYPGKGQALPFLDSNKDYRFFYRHLASFLRNYGKDHKLPGLSTYWARHSWATIAASLDIPKETISAALGHSIGSEITAIYIDFDNKKVDEANRKVLDWVLYKKR